MAFCQNVNGFSWTVVDLNQDFHNISQQLDNIVNCMRM